MGIRRDGWDLLGDGLGFSQRAGWIKNIESSESDRHSGTSFAHILGWKIPNQAWERGTRTWLIKGMVKKHDMISIIQFCNTKIIDNRSRDKSKKNQKNTRKLEKEAKACIPRL